LDSYIRQAFWKGWFYRLARGLCRIVLGGLGRWQVEGQARVPRSGGVLVIANHVSDSDPLVVGSALARPAWYMAKMEHFEMPLLGPLIRALQAFPVQRGRPDRRALRRALELLAAGEVVVVFPEGRDSLTGDLQPLEAGAALLALYSGVPVVPVGLRGTRELLPMYHFIPRPAHVLVRFGSPIPFEDLGDLPRRERLNAMTRRMAASLARLIET
jgi:1-acyl-sn-glycerol-3-phosphate acyltransferase